MQQYVDSARTIDPNTVQVTFGGPAPHFFDFISYKYDIGLQVVPKHIFEGQDWASFKQFDLAKGLQRCNAAYGRACSVGAY